MSEEPGQVHGDTRGRQMTCPNCEAELYQEANFCANCGTAVSKLTNREGKVACPDCAVAVAVTDNFCFSCGATLSNHQGSLGDVEPHDDAFDAPEVQANEPEVVPESLILAVEGYEMTVYDGDTVGSKIRAALSRAGRPDTEVVRIHREHVRFIRKSDSFYILDMGDNPTHLNGVALTKGDQRPVAPGDELELSAVAGVTIRHP